MDITENFPSLTLFPYFLANHSYFDATEIIMDTMKIRINLSWNSKNLSRRYVARPIFRNSMVDNSGKIH